MPGRRCTAAAAVFAVVLGSAQAFKGSTSIRHVRAAPTVVCSLQPQAVSRRHAGLLGGALLLSPPSAWAARAAKKSAGGKWAQHYDEFTPDELEGFTETASGLQYKDIAEGDGAMPAKGQGVYAHYSGYLLVCVYACMCVCHYVGMLYPVHACMHACMHAYMHACVHTNTCTHTCTHTYMHAYIHAYMHTCIHTCTYTRARARAHTHTHTHTQESGNLFDSSYERGKPLQFAVGTGRVIKGWDEALLTMRVGGRRMLVIPAELGYGAKGIGPIPPNADLVFYVELVAIGS